MYRQNKKQETSIVKNESGEGELIETFVERMVNNGEYPGAGTGIFSETLEAANQEHDIRSDKWIKAAETMDKVTTAHRSNRASKGGHKAENSKGVENNTSHTGDIKQPD